MRQAEILRRLDEAFPGRELVRKSEIADWLGISKKTMAKKYALPPGSLVSKAAVARAMTQ